MTNGTFLGRKMMQTDKALWLWEKILSSTDFKRIIEIGTSSGNFSLFLYLFCLEKGAEFFTFDVRHYLSKQVIKRFGEPGVVKEKTDFLCHFNKLDIFQDEEFIAKKIKEEGITILFCDGGNKIKEYNTFVGSLKKGDIIAVHDWLTEIFPDELGVKLNPIFEVECQEESMTKFFQK